MKNVFRKLMQITLAAAITVSLMPSVPCYAEQSSSGETLAGDDSQYEIGDEIPVAEVTTSPETEAFAEKLKAVEGISDVRVESDTIIAYMEQPLDWQTDTGITLQQKFTVRYKGENVPTCYEVGGYDLLTSVASLIIFPDDCTYNKVSIEYRFFGESQPEGLDRDSTELWPYLTLENAAEDIHAIISRLSSLLPGKRIMTGVSKGGFTTNYQAYKYPEDADLFLPFCAPLCESRTDSRLYEFINHSVGDAVLPAEQAEEMRNAILEFQVECMRYKDDLKVAYKEKAIQEAEGGEDAYRPILMEDDGAKFFDFALADAQAIVWMNQAGFEDYCSPDGAISTFENVVSMPADTEEQIAAKKEALLELLCRLEPPSGFVCSTDNIMFVYTMQSAMQMGNYSLDLTPLEERIAEEQEKDPSFPGLSLTEEEKQYPMMYQMLTEEQREMAFEFPLAYDEMVEWEKTTTANVVMVFGAVDPWYIAAIPESGNPNVKRILATGSDLAAAIGHSAAVTMYNQEARDAIYEALSDVFGYTVGQSAVEDIADLSEAADTEEVSNTADSETEITGSEETSSAADADSTEAAQEETAGETAQATTDSVTPLVLILVGAAVMVVLGVCLRRRSGGMR